MQAIRRWAGAALAAVVLVTSSVAQAAYSSLFVFGDSLSDPGNAAALTPRASPLPPLFPPTPSGRFSNGPTAAEYLAGYYGVPVVGGWPGAAGATNMAVGGALTGNGNYNFIINDPAGLRTNAAYATVGVTGAAQQIAAFTSANPMALADPNALTMLWAGPNDFFLAFAQAAVAPPADPIAFFQTATATAVMNMAANIVALATGGAKNIFVPNMPDLGLTPALIAAGAQNAGLATQLTNAYNFGLAAVIAQAATNLGPLGVRFYAFDTAAYFRDAVDGTPPVGITNWTDACIDSPSALQTNCAGYLFFDGVHPTTFAHSLLAAQFYDATVPEPSTYALMALGLLALAFASRRRRA